MKVIKNTNWRKEFEKEKGRARGEGQKFCNPEEKAYCSGESWLTVGFYSDQHNKILGQYDLFQEPFFCDGACPTSEEINHAKEELMQAMCNGQEVGETLTGTVWCESRVYCYNMKHDFRRIDPIPVHVDPPIVEILTLKKQ